MARMPVTFAFVMVFLIAAILHAQDGHDKTFAQRAQTTFDQAQIQYQSQAGNPVVAWEFARACFDLADWATNKSERATIAKQGIAACQQSLTLTNSAAAHYYLAMNMGQLARTELIGALKLVDHMESEFQAAASLDPRFDFAGPERGLGLLYLEAPDSPVSIGSQPKASQFLGSAVRLAPDYPENILNLTEAYLTWDDHANAQKELQALDALWPSAQTNLTGEKWEQSWDDWSKRRAAARSKLNQP